MGAMEWGIVCIVAFVIVGVIWTRIDTQFNKGFRESNGIFDDRDLYFPEEIEILDSRTRKQNLKSSRDSVNTGFFSPSIIRSDSSSSFFG